MKFLTEKELKVLFESILTEYGFEKRRYIYVRDFDSFSLRVSFQNSPGSEDYHLDCYFLLKELHEERAIITFLIADITNRQKFIVNEKETEFIRIVDFSYEDMSKILEKAMNDLVTLVEKEGLKGYLKKYPEAIDSAPTNSAKYFEKIGLIEK